MEGRCWRPNPVPCSGHGMALLPKRDVFGGSMEPVLPEHPISRAVWVVQLSMEQSPSDHLALCRCIPSCLADLSAWRKISFILCESVLDLPGLFLVLCFRLGRGPRMGSVWSLTSHWLVLGFSPSPLLRVNCFAGVSFVWSNGSSYYWPHSLLLKPCAVPAFLVLYCSDD